MFNFPQVVLEKKLTLFIDDPLKMPGLEKNEDWVKFGYGYYVGAPWVVGQIRGSYVCSSFNAGCKISSPLYAVDFVAK